MPNIDRDDENATRYEMPKPTIDEQIAFIGQEQMKATHIQNVNPAYVAMFHEVADTLRAHKRITEAAGRPEPNSIAIIRRLHSDKLTTEIEVQLIAHIDTLLAYADRMAAEMGAAHIDITRLYESLNGEVNARETAERQLAELQRKYDGLVARLREPTDSMNKAGVAVGNEQASHAQHCDEVFTAMSAVALDKGGE